MRILRDRLCFLLCIQLLPLPQNYRTIYGRLFLALLPYAGDWAYRHEREHREFPT